MMGDDLSAFLAERNEVLLSGDLDRVVAFHTKYNPGVAQPSREVMEAGMHKARTACLALAPSERAASRKWLTDRGMKHFGDEE